MNSRNRASVKVETTKLNNFGDVVGLYFPGNLNSFLNGHAYISIRHADISYVHEVIDYDCNVRLVGLPSLTTYKGLRTSHTIYNFADKRLGEFEIVTLGLNCDAILVRQLNPPEDPSSRKGGAPIKNRVRDVGSRARKSSSL